MSFVPCCGSSTDEDNKRFLDIPESIEIPVKDRKPTDLKCLIVLITVFLFVVISMVVACIQGDFKRVIHGHDDKGNVCGYKNTPIEGVRGSGLDLRHEKFLQVTVNCNFDNTNCWAEGYCVPSCSEGYEVALLAYCVPKEEQNGLIAIESFWEMVIMDLSLCWKEIIVLCFFSIVLSGLFLTVLRMFAKVVIKLLLVTVSLVAISCTVYSWSIFSEKEAAFRNARTLDEERKSDYLWKFNERNSAYEKELKMKLERDSDNWLYVFCLLTTLTVIFFIMLFCLRKKLRLIPVLFEEGGKCIRDIPTMLLQPILTYLIAAVFTCFVLFCYICFGISGTAQIDIDGKVSFPVNLFFQITTWILFFVLLWVNHFFLACQNLVIAGAVSSWYFSRVKGQLINPVWKSFCVLMKNHLGSAAFGSLLIAIIKVFRTIIKMFQRRDSSDAFALVLWAMFHCLLACLETFLKMISKTAYVMIMILGEPFCSSARRAFAFITSDSSKIALLIGVETFILAVTEILITFCVTILAVALFSKIEGIQNFWIPTYIVFILSILCCDCFFSVYQMTINTLMLCFCVDHQMNDGLEKPYYMNQNLMVLLNEDNKTSYPMTLGANGGNSTLVVTVNE